MARVRTKASSAVVDLDGQKGQPMRKRNREESAPDAAARRERAGGRALASFLLRLQGRLASRQGRREDEDNGIDT